MLPISIIIATYNRREELRSTLKTLCSQEYGKEIIVVDNRSTDDTTTMVRQEFPDIKLIERVRNEGVPAFDVGVSEASQPFVFLLDDDAIPELGTIKRVVEILEQAPQIAVVACHIIDGAGSPITVNWPDYPICFWGCGAAVRKTALSDQPYMFDPRLFLHGTEMDLAVRLYAAGYVVKYSPEAVVHHRFSLQNRSEGKRIYFLTQSALWFGLKHLPFRFAISAIARHLAWLFYRATREGYLRAYISGLADACRKLPSVLADRHPVPVTVARVYYDQVWEYEPLVFRLSRSVFGWPPSRRYLQEGFPQINSGVALRKVEEV